MATKVRPTNAPQDVVMHFPRAGIDLSMSLEQQPARAIAEKEYARTTPTAVNVRGFDPTTGRSRGGSRSGLAKYALTPVVADWVVQELALIVGSGYSPPGGTMQTSNSGRVVTLVSVSQGNVYVRNAGDTAWTTATNGTADTPPLNYTGIMQSTVVNQKLFFADGVNWKYYDPATNTVHDWLALSGSLPTDSEDNAPRLICTWRGRIVLSGFVRDPHNWFMTAVSNPFDFNYAGITDAATGTTAFSPTQAIAGNNAPQGLIGDVVTGLIPYSDDALIILCDSSIYLFRGDPCAGGQIDLVCKGIGGAWGQAWCMGPDGTVYFMSNRCGIYSLVPGRQPQKISQAIEQLLEEINTGTSTVLMIWEERFQGFHVFVTPTDAPDAATHYFYEERTGAWWTDEFANDNHNPLACCVFDGNEVDDRVAVIGSWDGYIRFFDGAAIRDDGKNIASEVVIGPILTPNTDDMMLKEIQAVLAEDSGDVTYKVYVGRTAEAALASDPVETGTWTAGRNPNRMCRRRGHAIYVKITATNPWAMETIRAAIGARGKVARRNPR